MFQHFRQVQYPCLLAEGFTPATNKWYCGFCIDDKTSGTGFFSKESASFHVEREHGWDKDELVEGEHVLMGTDLWVKLIRWREECRKDVQHFVNVLDSMVGAEDFAIDFRDPESEAA